MTDKQINTCEFLNICQTNCNGTLEDTEVCHCYELYKQLKRKEQECERLLKGYAELTEIVSPYMDDFTGYNEELGGFDIVLCVKELLQQLKAENEQAERKLERIRDCATALCYTVMSDGVITLQKDILKIIDKAE